MRWIARVLGVSVVAVVAAALGLGCSGPVQVQVGTAPPVATRASCASVCTQMANCPGKGPTCPQTCQSATSLSAQAGCDASLQAELDCLSTQPEVCGATRGACQTVTVALASCITNYCTHERMGSPNQALCLQAAQGF
jgi:hypothetical protein